MNDIIRAVEGGGSGFRYVDLILKDGRLIIKGEPVKPQAEIKSVDELLSFVTTGLSPSTIGIAYSMAGLIKNHSWIINSPNIKFLNGIDLGSFTIRRTNLPVYVANDMEAATMGIYVILTELGIKADNFVAITWSSGLGVRFCVDGKIPFSSEAGHMLRDTSEEAYQCGCGKYGCFESIIGGKSIEKWLPKILNEARPGENIMSLLDRGYLLDDSGAIEAYNFIANEIGIFLAQLKQINTDFDLIAWKGTLAIEALSLPGIEDIIRLSMRENVMDKSMESMVKFHIITNEASQVRDRESFLGCGQLWLNKYHLV